MSMFIRRFLTDPGADVLLEIESVNILDLEPPADIAGVGTGAAMLVGEFENGPFATPTEVTSGGDVQSTFGGVGYAYNGVGGQNPCARARLADSALVTEYWNGNGAVQLSGKKFARLILVRVDTSVGAVQFTRVAYLTGAAQFAYPMTSGNLITVNPGTPATATFTGTAATHEGAVVTDPSTFAGGETLTLGFDDASANPNFTVTFLAADQTIAQVVARINLYAGFTFATATSSSTKITLTGRQKGTGGQVRVVSASSGVLTKLGLSVANYAGGGNVANIAAVTFAEVKLVVETASVDVLVTQDQSGRLRISNKVGATTLSVTAMTATSLGFPIGTTNDPAAGNAGVIPAGTVVQKSDASTVLVTMQDVVVSSSSPGPYPVKVRHATDDGTGLAAGAGLVATMPSPVSLDAFVVLNPQVVAAALSEAAIDTAYSDALASTLDANTVAAEVNIAWSARQSNSVRRTLKQNALDASAGGLLGRMACVRPPLGTLRAVAESTSAEPGVGATRDQRVIYCYPGANTTVPAIQRRGLAGGAGFTSTGAVDVGADGFMASVLSQLAPEENPGQSTNFMVAINGLESTLKEKLAEPDYVQFRAKGIAALRMDGGNAIFQSGVTSVDKLVNPGLVNIARRRMADYIEDSIARFAKGFGKKTSTVLRRVALLTAVRSFMEGLLGRVTPGSQRIAGFTVSAANNTPDTLKKGIYRIDVFVQTLSSLDSIVLGVTAGEQVSVEETLPAAA